MPLIHNVMLSDQRSPRVAPSRLVSRNLPNSGSRPAHREIANALEFGGWQRWWHRIACLAGLVQVAKAIAEGKVKMTISDLDRLIRLEEYLREGPGGPIEMKLDITWTECGKSDEDEGEDDSEED